MAQDIRELFKNDNSMPTERLEKGHQSRFEARLDALQKGSSDAANVVTMDTKSTSKFHWMKIAAIFIVALSIGILGYNQLSTSVADADTNVVNLDKMTPDAAANNIVPVFLSEVSPQYKEVEDYYMASINMELAKLQVNEENKELIDAFMAQLAELDAEYRQLNRELKEAGVNEQTVNTLIANLQLRLELLFKLKSKLNQLKQSQNGINQEAKA